MTAPIIPMPPRRPAPAIGLTAAQKIAVSERKIWLASHKAPPGLSLISDDEMQSILAGISQEARGRQVAQNALKVAQKYVNELFKVVETAELAVQQIDALTLAGTNPTAGDQLTSLRCRLANLNKFLRETPLPTPPP